MGELCLKKEKKMEFEEFWKEYPRKIAKGDARKAWAQTEKFRPDIQTIIKAIKAAKQTDSWRENAGKYIPYPATWLRAERWDDDYGVELENTVEIEGKIVNWWESATGIEKKGGELGLKPEDFPSFPDFKAAVMRQSMRAA